MDYRVYYCRRCGISTGDLGNFRQHCNRKTLCAPTLADVDPDYEASVAAAMPVTEHKCHCGKCYSKASNLARHVKKCTTGNVTNNGDHVIINNTTNITHNHGSAERIAELDAGIAKARTALDQAEVELQDKLPNYNALVQQVVPAATLFAVLRPGEAFAAITLAQDGGWLRQAAAHSGLLRA